MRVPTGAVWAPRAHMVELELDLHDGLGPRRRSMHRSAGDWWLPETPLAPGTAYRFVLDRGAPLPDPRSRWQPEGIDGPSVVVERTGFAWTDHHWHGRPLAAAVISEVHVGTFSPAGTYDGVIERLDDLLDVGVNTIELLPLATFPGRRGWGYDGVLLGAPHPAYGTPADLDRLVDEAHRRGIAVILDVVYNHLGPSGNHLGRFGPYFTDRYRTPWGDAVNLDDAGSHEVRRFFVDNALGWICDHHLDGLRLDAVHAFGDRSAVPFLEELTAAVHAEGERLGRQVWVIGESDLNDPRLVVAPEAGGFGLDAVWSDDFHHALHGVLTGERDGYYTDFGRIADLAKALRDVYVHDGGYSPHRGRNHGRPVGDLPRTRFLGYAQNHDQIGNRARGERLVHLVGVERARIAAALVALGPFVPLLFQGEEWGATAPFRYVTDHTDPELADAVRQGRRAEFAAFGWRPEDVPDPQDPATFVASTLDWSERDRSPHAELLAWHRALLALRRHRVPPRSRTVVAHDDDAHWLRLDRITGDMDGDVDGDGDVLSVAVNLGPSPTAVPLGQEIGIAGADRSLLLASSAEVNLGRGQVLLGPWDVAVLGPPDGPEPAGQR